jgi:hypothetical protein
MARKSSTRLFLSVMAAALGGNWVGAQIRTRLTGQPTPGVIIHYKDERGNEYLTLPVHTNFFPAILCARIGRPRWVFSFLGGVLTSLVMGDKYEKRLLEWIGKRVSG